MEWSYEDVTREILQGLLNGVILELAFRDDIVMHKDIEKTKRMNYREVAGILTDMMNGADDEQFKKFKNKLVDLIYDI